MTPSAPVAKPSAGAVNRRWRNYLLEPRFQLKFTSYIVFSSLVLALLLGAFLVRSTQVLMKETESAVEARSRAAEASRSLSTATLNNELLARMDDPEFESQLQAKSQAIDAAYEAERSAIVAQRAELVHQQRLTWAVLFLCLLAFIVGVALATIVATHRFVGYRLPRALLQLRQGVGRLIRSHGDRGVVIIADPGHASYRPQLLAALSGYRVETLSWAEARVRVHAELKEMGLTLSGS